MEDAGAGGGGQERSLREGATLEVRRRTLPEPLPKFQQAAEDDFPEAEPALCEEEENSSEVIPIQTHNRELLQSALEGQVRFSQMGTVMLDLVSQLKTPLGKFWKVFDSHAAAQGEPAAHNEVLPISLAAIQGCRQWRECLKDWLMLICGALNYQYCSGFSSPKYLRHRRDLSSKQMFLLENHLRPAVERLLEKDTIVPSPEEIREELGRHGHNYDGTTYVVMEELDFEKVVECWPTRDQAAVAPLEDFLKGETLAHLKAPMQSILPPEEWPKDIPKSYVRASDETWCKLVEEGYRRGLFQACPEAEVLTDPTGRKILNGAGAVQKFKGDRCLQRFISIFCPLNSVSRKITGDEDTLPYVGQVNLLFVPEEAEVVIDSEDMASAFNLFEMPTGWRGLFCYEKQVPAHFLGLEGDAPTYVSLRTVPMGWISAVGIVQAAIRHLAFEEAGLPLEAEVQKWKELPAGDRLLLYLDSVDQLRIVSKPLAKLCAGENSEEHTRFKEACIRKGLPTNAAKSLAGSLKGSLQGGELRSEDGVFMLQETKMKWDIGMAAYLLSQANWNPREVASTIGRLVFAAAFRRPLLAVMDELFQFVRHWKEGKPTASQVDELVSMMALLPLAFTNVRACVYGKLSATDASPTGAGSCIAGQLKRPRDVPNPKQLACGQCRGDMTELMASGEDVECPLHCGTRLCSMECFLEHRSSCENAAKPLPLFSERWAGERSPLTRAMLQEGFDVARPFDIKVSPLMDIFSQSGRAIWDDLDAQDADVEHHATDCKSFSRARGRPFWINGQWYKGPPALRDERHVMGFPNVRGQAAVQVRQGNRMALRSIKRCTERHHQGRIFSLEHPWRSFIWYMTATTELAALPGVYMATFSNCCFGGRRQKWTALLTNSRALFEALHKPKCEHGLVHDYQPYFDDQDTLRFPTEEEAEYPPGLVEAYARAIKADFQQNQQWPEDEPFRVSQLAAELEKYGRFQVEELRLKVAARVFEMEQGLVAGQENKARYHLLSNGHYRGTDIRFAVEHLAQREMVPYPAYRWLWRDTLSFRWKQEAHINELETQALIAHVRRLLREDEVKQVRVMIVVDSQVLFYAIGKGRSPSKRLNRLMRRLTALQLMGDLYVLPIWTLSAWNFADRPSRRA